MLSSRENFCAPRISFTTLTWEHLSIFARLEKINFKITRLEAPRKRLNETMRRIHSEFC